MAKLKKYSVWIQHFVLFLTIGGFIACSQQVALTRVQGQLLPVAASASSVPDIENFVKPYRDSIDHDLSTVLAYAPVALEKTSGKWQTTIGSLIADVSLRKGDSVFFKTQHQHLDLCLMNHGGIRAPIPQGNVTTRVAFEVMPFENSLIVEGLTKNQLLELVNYLIADKKPHPLSGLTFDIDSDHKARNILVQGKPLEDRVYCVLTSDYLANGGDNMAFFKTYSGKYDLNYKIRNVLIDYFREADTLPVTRDERIKELLR